MAALSKFLTGNVVKNAADDVHSRMGKKRWSLADLDTGQSAARHATLEDCIHTTGIHWYPDSRAFIRDTACENFCFPPYCLMAEPMSGKGVCHLTPLPKSPKVPSTPNQLTFSSRLGCKS